MQSSPSPYGLLWLPRIADKDLSHHLSPEKPLAGNAKDQIQGFWHTGMCFATEHHSFHPLYRAPDQASIICLLLYHLHIMNPNVVCPCSPLISRFTWPFVPQAM